MVGEDGIAAEVYSLCGGKIDFLFNVNPGNHVVNVARSMVKCGFFGFRDNDFASEVRSRVGDTLFVNATSDGNELTIRSTSHSCKELLALVEHESLKIYDKIKW